MARRKPQRSRAKNQHERRPDDFCQTPPYAVEPLRPYVGPFLDYLVWEAAVGEGYLVYALKQLGFTRFLTGDIETGQNYFTQPIPREPHIEITNIPFTLKYDWLAYACTRSTPFAFLAPSDLYCSQRGWDICSENGIEIIVPRGRICYKMPNKGWKGSANFSTSWFTRGLNIGSPLTYARIEIVEPPADWTPDVAIDDPRYGRGVQNALFDTQEYIRK